MTTHALIEECRAALAEELAAWNIDPPLHHVKQAHDRCVKWLAMTHTVESLMMLADKVARCDVERGIPTGGLYRGITHNAWVNARDELRHALAQALAPTAQPVAEPMALLWRCLKALKLAGAMCDRVPHRAHTAEPDGALRDLGVMVNKQNDGSHGYRVIYDALEDLEKYLTTPTAQPAAEPRSTK